MTGVGGNLLEAIVNALSPENPIVIPEVLNISNIVATRDIVSEVGLSIAPPIVLTVESQSPLGAHSIAGVTDTLAVYNLFDTVDSSLTVEVLSGLLEAVSGQANNSLESALSALGAIYGKSYSATEATRDILYTNLYDLESAIGNQPAGGMTIDVLGNTSPLDGTFTPFSPSQIETLARTDIAYRYSLVQGNAFAALGADYSAFNQNGELDGQLTNMIGRSCRNARQSPLCEFERHQCQRL